MPILISVADSTKPSNRFWLGKKYNHQISNKLSEQETYTKYTAFSEQVQTEFDTTDFQNFIYLEAIGNTNDHDEFNNAIKNSKIFYTDPYMIFEAQTQPFENRTGNKLEWVFASLGMGLVLFFIFLLFPKFKENRLADISKQELKWF